MTGAKQGERQRHVAIDEKQDPGHSLKEPHGEVM